MHDGRQILQLCNDNDDITIPLKRHKICIFIFSGHFLHFRYSYGTNYVQHLLYSDSVRGIQYILRALEFA